MPKRTMREAINDALHFEMARDASVIVIGEDVSGGAGGSSGQRDAAGGVFGLTRGLLPKFGEARVIDTPISESAIVGAANGAALAGYRPVAEIMFNDFIGVCFDQILNQAAKFRYMFGGKAKAPLVIRMTIGAGRSAAAQHSQSLYPILTSIAGIKVVVPSNPYDAKGLLLTAIRDDDPVIYLEHKLLYNDTGEVPDGDYTVPSAKPAWCAKAGTPRWWRSRAWSTSPPAWSTSSPPKASPATSSIHAPPRRWTRRPFSTACAKPGAWSSWMRRRPAAAWRPTSPGWSRTAASSGCARPSFPSRRRTRPFPSRPIWSACTCPTRPASSKPSGR